jgi:hypothetical protein
MIIGEYLCHLLSFANRYAAVSVMLNRRRSVGVVKSETVEVSTKQ